MSASAVRKLEEEITGCKRCPRLVAHCREIARVKRKAFASETYWGKPVPGFGDPDCRLLIIGLAPAAHGANRTGRMFTGDRSGDWLYRALHKAGFANQPTSVTQNDGLELRHAYVTASARCAPPDNKPLPDELKRCGGFLDRELEIFDQVRVYLCLGQIAFDMLWKHIGGGKTRPKFGHGVEIPLENGRAVLLSYHPSQQNTFTGRLTEPMFDRVFARARELTK